MQGIAMDLNNKNDIFENTLLLGNVKDRIKLLMQTGQIALAYMSAKAHNMVEFIPFIEEEIKNREIKLTDNFLEQAEERSRKAKCVLPCRPVFISNEDFTTKNWPYTMLLESNLEEKMKHDHEEFYDAKAAPENAEQDMNDFLSSLKEQKAPEPEIKPAPSKEESKKPKVEEDDLGGQNWEGGIDIDADILNEIGGDEIDLAELEKEIYNEQTEKDNPSSAPPNPLFVLVGDSVIPAHHIAVGNFEKAVELLKNQIGLCNPLPLKDSFDYIFNNTKIDSATCSKYNSMNELIKDKSGQNSVSPINLEYLKQVFKEGFTETTSGNFGPALTAYQKCIQHAAVSLAMNSDEEDEIKRLINNCVEYIIAMRIELKRRDKAVTITEQDNLLLAMLMSVCKLHPSHSFLVLNNAMNCFYKAQNFVSAAYFAEQILNLESKGIFKNKPEMIEKYKKYVAAFQKKNTESISLVLKPENLAKIDEANGFICSGSLTLFSEALKGKQATKGIVRCPFDGAIYSESYKGKICAICNIAQVGSEGQGICIMDLE